MLRTVNRQCVACQKAYAKTASQLMGQLPAARSKPSPPFSTVGIDYAGPVQCKRGNPRKPTLVKCYICLFICFSTKAVHLELISDLTYEAFLATFSRFVGRRGCPSQVFTDNGTNFVGANRELQDLQHLMEAKETQNSIHYFSSEHNFQWTFSPSRAPHFGGLWESGVKIMKGLIRKNICHYILSFEELNTVLVEAEATLNSRPLTAVDSHSPDGASPLMPGHFLIGRPLRAPPVRIDQDRPISTLKRWNLIRRLSADLWQHWNKWFCVVCSSETSGEPARRICNPGTLSCLRK